ncbi:MAG: Na/Pi symporter, partial [Acidobacteriota bacterium]
MANLKRVLFLLGLLYLFLIGIALMGTAFKLLGRGFAEALIQTASNPVVALMIGMLATAIIQSSSTTTSLIVGMVAGGALDLASAIPMVMGANIGTTVTNTLVAMMSMNRREEFRRSFAGATMHDFFNFITVLVFLPLEMGTHVLQRAALFLADFLVGKGTVEFSSPVKVITKPVASALVHGFSNLGWSAPTVGLATLGVAVGGIVLAV